MPQRPLLIFDGDCRFCRLWIKHWQQITGEQIDYAPFQDTRVAQAFPEIPLHIFEKSVQLIETDGTVYRGAEAVFRARAYNPRQNLLFRLYQKVPAFAAISESFYAWVARHRTFFRCKM